jgi:MYXO-CTERM domain-containing protein
MKFEFQPVVYYERSMLDGDKLVERKVPLENRQALIESVDVGFLDPGSGKIEKRTKFVFRVTRAHGYEAGEYQVTIRDGRSGDMIGTPARLIFQGENEIIDRRAMVFAGGDKKKKKSADEKEKTEPSDGAGEASATPEEGSEPAESSESGAESEPEAASADEETPAAEPQGEVKEKPGGCGCRAAGSSGPRPAHSLLVAGAVALALARRRRGGQRSASAT